MANSNLPNGFRCVMTGNGQAPQVWTEYTKSNLSLRPGDPIIMLSTGLLDIATASSTAIYGVSQSEITGVAATKAKCNFIPAFDDYVFEGQCSGTYTPVNCGESVDIEGSTGAFMINEDAQSVGVARILCLSKNVKNAAGQYARVWFTWVKSQISGQA